MRSATYLRSYRGKQSVITVGKAMTSQQGSRVSLTIRPDPVLVSADTEPSAAAAEEQA